jgi:membrane-associated PAP2 superfamily phosphatase
MGFWVAHAVLPVVATAILTGLLMGLHGDLVVADSLYALQGNEWLFKKTFLAEKVIHIAGRNASILLWLTALAVWLTSFKVARWAVWRRPWGYLVLAVAAGVTSVSILKAISTLDCPWSLTRYGGSRIYFGFFDLRPDLMTGGGCFPAGHASAGYGWLALYFFLVIVKPEYRGHGLAFGLLAGIVFGATQQLRGAHFLSHDVWSLAICWLVSLGIFLIMFKTETIPQASASITDHG